MKFKTLFMSDEENTAIFFICHSFLKPFIKGNNFAVRNGEKFNFDHHFAFLTIMTASVSARRKDHFEKNVVQNGPFVQIL